MLPRLRLFVTLSLVLAACGGGGDSSGPPPTYPAIDGTWELVGTFNDFTPALANVSGTISIEQPSVDSPDVSATAALAAYLEGTAIPITVIHHVTISPSGVLKFQVNTLNPDATWHFTGKISGASLIGSHVLSDGTHPFRGLWHASRSDGEN